MKPSHRIYRTAVRILAAASALSALVFTLRARSVSFTFQAHWRMTTLGLLAAWLF
jgi:hypothetical protein